MEVRQLVGGALVRAGRFAGPLPRILNGAANFLATGSGLTAAGIVIPPAVRTRWLVFDAAIKIASTAKRPLYLEFGVWRGESIAYWSQRLGSANARFIGFDSFDGLPERWTTEIGEGSFSTAGRTPTIDDPRVRFITGWFSETLSNFEPPDHDLLIINVDCDIYASATTVLNWCEPLLKPRSLLYFDEFHDRLHEGRAFHELRARSGYEFEMLARTPEVTNVLFRRVA